MLTLISPPDERAEFWDGLVGRDLASMSTGVLCGLFVRSHATVTAEEAAHLQRILRPGAHLLLMAPETEPTGHTGACEIEDAGFEIRDAILLVREPGRLHYVPKASRSEREAGCEHLPARSGAEAVDREEDTAGLDSPRAGAGRTAQDVRNHHPTVKSVQLMERILADVSKDVGPVLEPFLGSGSTGIACVRTGHEMIGIEREAEYMAIAEARIEHEARKTSSSMAGFFGV
jgi:DNA modification methylase